MIELVAMCSSCRVALTVSASARQSRAQCCARDLEHLECNRALKILSSIIDLYVV